MSYFKSWKWCFLGLLIPFFFVGKYIVSPWLLDTQGPMQCTAQSVMTFEEKVTDKLNVNIHFGFARNGRGTIVVEGYSHSQMGWKYMQRFVNFDYEAKSLSNVEWEYKVNNWSSHSSPLDATPDFLFEYFMNEMAGNYPDLRIQAKQLNSSTVLLSSIHSPLFICSLTQ